MRVIPTVVPPSADRVRTETQRFLGDFFALHVAEFVVLNDFQATRLAEKKAAQEARRWVERSLFELSERVPGGRTLLTQSHARVSHQGWAIVAGLLASQGSRELGLGVDLERASRMVSDRLFRKLTMRDEANPADLSRIGLWAMKEASFKANPENRGTVLSEYRLESWDGDHARATFVWRSDSRAVHFDALLVADRDWVVALALAR